MPEQKVVLDEDDIRRTLVRIAHEIVEKNAGRPVALVGIHRRGAHLATRLHRLVCDLLGAATSRSATSTSPSTATTSPPRRVDPEVHATHLPFRLEDYTVVLVDDVLYTGRTVRAGDRGAVRLRAPRARPARRAGRPRPPRAPDPPRLRRQEPADRAQRARQRPRHARSTASTRSPSPSLEEAIADEAPAVDRGPRPRRHRAHPGPREVLHRGLRARDQEGPRAARPPRAEPLLRGLHAHAQLASSWPPSRCRADVINFASGGSSVEKGESLKDTVQTLSAYRPDLIVIRTPHVGAAALVAGWTTAGVVNAGDGKHEHPTQALLDVYTLRERLGSLDGLNIWIVGDVTHSRVARSNILAFTKMGAKVTVCGPPTLIPRGIEALGCDVALHARRPAARPTSSTRCGCRTSA